MIESITYLMAVASMIGTVANSFQKKWCFYVWFCTNLFWIIYNLKIRQYAQMLLYIFNLATCVIGILKWKGVK